MNDTGAKQQIVDKIKDSSNILVTVSTDPSVDELSAALGLTLLLNKMDKHATAVFSGAVPPAITFLDPQKTFENTVDSLRDFIIALDKEKADHLRYKVDGDVVKIFITPYRTTISSDDLDFSQGDYNVELVLALGVKNQDHLDNALSAHGRILHDATVVTISAGSEKSELGSIDWREENASSLSEMLVTLADGLKSGKALLDEQIATSFLTGIVAATDRFSNNKTSSKVMTVAAQLMGAGANQQLIASKLEEAHEIGQDAKPEPSSTKEENSDGTTDLSEGKSTKVNKKKAAEKQPEPEAEKPKEDDGSLTISHEKKGDVDEVAAQTEEEQRKAAAEAAEEELAKQAREVPEKQQSEAAAKAEENLANQLAGVAPAASSTNTPSVADLQKDLAEASSELDEASQQPPSSAIAEPAPAPLSGAVSEEMWKNKDAAPLMGGVLNATTEQAANDKRQEIEADRNRTILSHGGAYVGGQSPTFQSPLNAAVLPVQDPPMIDPLQDTMPAPAPMPLPPAPAPQPELPPLEVIQPPAPSSAPTLADIDQQNRAAPSHDEARAAVHAAFDSAPPAPDFSAGPAPADQAPAGLPPLPPLPDFSTLPPMPGAPDANAPALPPETLGETLPPAPAVPAAGKPADPGQFKIPGQ